MVAVHSPGQPGEAEYGSQADGKSAREPGYCMYTFFSVHQTPRHWSKVYVDLSCYLRSP